MTKIRIGLVGCGFVSELHMYAYKRVYGVDVEVSAVAARGDHVVDFAARHQIAKAYRSFGDLIADSELDVVDICTPPNLHGSMIVDAMQAGKHVICEKPMATTVEESEAMIAACEKANRKLMIAYRCQLEPTTLHARQLIQSGALGKIQAIESANGFNIAQGEWRTNRKLAGGGPLMDVGIYSLNACRFLTGEEPTQISAYSSIIDHDGRFNDVEENISWTMKFPSGIVASCNSTYGARMEGFYRVHGSKGTIHVEPAFGYQGIHLIGHIAGAARGDSGKPLDDLEQEKDPAQFVRQAEYFARCIVDDKKPGPSGEEGLRDMKLMMQIYKSAGLRS